MFLLNFEHVWAPAQDSTRLSFVELLGEFEGKWAFHVFIHADDTGYLAKVNF